MQEKWIQRGASSHELRKSRENKRGQGDVLENKTPIIQEDLISCVCNSIVFYCKLMKCDSKSTSVPGPDSHTDRVTKEGDYSK